MPRALWLALAALGVVLTATVVPGVFSVDEDHQLVSVLALSEGRLTVAATEGLPASRELLWFDPAGYGRRVEATPVAPVVPPLYAPLALPFLPFGWRGLVALNTLAFLVTAGLVFLLARRHAERPETAWFAALVYVACGHTLEYAQGVWPHCLAIALTFAAVVLADRALGDRDRDGRGPGAAAVPPHLLAVAAGLCAGLAAGVRYQNVVFAGAVGLALFLLAAGRRRWTLPPAYALGAALPLALSSWLNQARLGSWNPISKGPGYFPTGGGGRDVNRWFDAIHTFWFRVVDYSTRPPRDPEQGTILLPDPESGAYVMASAVKKAWLQSAPWLLVALLLLAASWFAWSAGGERWRRLRLVALPVAAVLAVFALVGSARTDGFSFNQRYLLELVPLASVAFAWAVEPLLARRRLWLLGALAGLAAVALLATWPPDSALRQTAVMRWPLALTVVATLAWAAARRWPRAAGAAALLLGVCLGWSAGVTLMDDLRASRGVRGHHQARFEALRGAIPDRSALFAWWGQKDAAGPLLLDRDLVVVDPWMDGGETAGELADALLADERRLFVLLSMPRPVFDAIRGGRPVRPVEGLPFPLVEILPGERPATGDGG